MQTHKAAEVIAVRHRYGYEDMWYQHYHRDFRACLDNTISERWRGRRGSVEYPHDFQI
ncbi:hypothetical protein L798_02424 [Zootermopsis nevadensis]|uniref:Uncharacterized protein n=1 Tax=Zootermopsis nevadensis TaxID=136037 RepID=A0A067QUE6_ZOONE|nr:hypothetical protein L798_02424 [Zootermopsis nevadensis]